jgi:3-oxoacyl-[acyl-carrier protein] reductase
MDVALPAPSMSLLKRLWQMDLGLNDKTALVLGASRGLGLGVARALLAEGARVVLSARHKDRLEQVREALPAGERERCFLVDADLSAPGAVERIVSGTTAEAGPIDVLVNNTGGPPPGLPSELRLGELQGQFEKMVRPVLALTLAFLPGMRQRRWGRILTIASSGVVQPIPQLAMSNSLRSALVGYMKTLAGEVAADGVTVNVLVPGRIATDRTHEIDLAAARREGRSEEDVARVSRESIPAARYGTTEEFGAVAAFLASRGASYVTGSIIRVDGGAIRSV